jgi:uncharacterized membrane protein YphA (DoxX/SURF4 family)
MTDDGHDLLSRSVIPPGSAVSRAQPTVTPSRPANGGLDMNRQLARTTRFLARALTGSTYALLGVDAYRTPGGRVDTASPLLASLRRVLPLPEDDKLLVRANGAAQVAAGTALALGILPRLSSAALAASMVPTTLAGHAYWTFDDPQARAGQRVQFHKNLAMIGGLLMAFLEAGRRKDAS